MPLRHLKLAKHFRIMRILQIIPTLDRGGAEKQLAMLAAGLHGPEFHMHVCALTRGGPLSEPLEAAGVPVTVIGKRWKADPRAWLRLRKLVRGLRPDIVHTWLFAANSYGRLAAWLEKVPVIVAGERCVDPWKSWRELTIDRWLARRTHCIAVNSSGVVDFYVERGLPRTLFDVIPNSIQPSTDPPYERDEFLKQLGAPRDAKLIGAVGRLWPQKRYQELLWSADLLATARDDTWLLIAGDGPELQRLSRFRQRLGFPERIIFLGHRCDVARWLPLLDVYWIASGYEGQSNGLMEAMLAGVPAVASDIPGNRDLIRDGQDGFVVALGDRAQRARRTMRLLDDSALAAKIGQAARLRMQSDFSLQRMLSGYAELYRRLRQSRAAGRGDRPDRSPSDLQPPRSPRRGAD